MKEERGRERERETERERERERERTAEAGCLGATGKKEYYIT